MFVIFYVWGIATAELTYSLDLMLMKFFELLFRDTALWRRLFKVLRCLLRGETGLYQRIFQLLHGELEIIESSLCQRKIDHADA